MVSVNFLEAAKQDLVSNNPLRIQITCVYDVDRLEVLAAEEMDVLEVAPSHD